MLFQRPAPVPGVLFDSDMGVNIDTALALAVLYGAASKMKVVGVTVTNPNFEAAAFCDVVARFYTTGGKLNTTPPNYHFAVGYAGEGPVERNDRAGSVLARTLAAKGADGAPTFGVNVKDLNDTGEVAVVIRNALTAQKDGEALMVSAGPATNLVRALALGGSKELIAAKIGTLVVAAGDFSGNSVDPRIKADVAAARRLFADWPTPIVVVGKEVGAAVPFPGSSIATDFAWSPAHPVVEAYKAWKPMPYDAPSQAVLAALYATDRKGDLLKLSEPGQIEVLDDGRTRFTPSAAGRHRYLLAGTDPEWKAKVVKAFTALASAKPAAPMGRGPRPQQQQQQQQAKPPQP